MKMICINKNKSPDMQSGLFKLAMCQSTSLSGTIMNQFPEVGYTPANLRFLLHSKEWNQKQFADFLGVNLRTVGKWIAGTSIKNHRDMPLLQWQKALELAA
jgi:DNA-binding transcriptional regulator YiaG